MPVRIDFARAVNDREYCSLVIDELERDISSGDELDGDRLTGILRLMKRMNAVLSSVQQDDEYVCMECISDGA